MKTSRLSKYIMNCSLFFPIIFGITALAKELVRHRHFQGIYTKYRVKNDRKIFEIPRYSYLFLRKFIVGKFKIAYISLKVSTLLSIESPHSQEKGAGISNKN